MKAVQFSRLRLWDERGNRAFLTPHSAYLNGIVVQKSFVQSSKKGLDTNLREETEKQEGEKVHKQKRCPREK